MDRKNVKKEDIRLVNIGGLNTLPDVLNTQASLYEWIIRLPSLYKPSKTHTMKYQTQQILSMDDHRFYDFNWQLTGDEWTELYLLHSRKKKLEQISQWII